jgi:hypothetical protein
LFTIVCAPSYGAPIERGFQMADNGPAPMRIVSVQLPDTSYKTSRVLTGDHGDEYPVIVYFSRAADAFERIALEEELDIKFDDRDPMCAIHYKTTLEVLDKEIDGINESIDNALANAHADREAAAREDERLKALAVTLSQKLRSAATN